MANEEDDKTVGDYSQQQAFFGAFSHHAKDALTAAMRLQLTACMIANYWQDDDEDERGTPLQNFTAAYFPDPRSGVALVTSFLMMIQSGIKDNPEMADLQMIVNELVKVLNQTVETLNAEPSVKGAN